MTTPSSTSTGSHRKWSSSVGRVVMSVDAVAMKEKPTFLNDFYSVFSKACFAIVGFCLKEAIGATLSSADIEADARSARSSTFSVQKFLTHLWPPFVCYLLLVLITVCAKLFVRRRLMSLTMSHKRRATCTAFIGGMDLIPAWSFKDCVEVLISDMQAPILTAVAVLVLAAGFAMLVDPLPLSADDLLDWHWDAVYTTRKTLAGCMGLGVGFATHIIPQMLCRYNGIEWFQLGVVLVYPLTMTVFVVLMQLGLDMLTSTQGGADAGAGAGADQPRFLKTLVIFGKIAGNFWAAFAWDTLFHYLRSKILPEGSKECWVQMSVDAGWAFAVLFLAVIVTGIVHVLERDTLPQDEFGPNFQRNVQALLALVSIMCTCWAFLDFAVGGYSCVHGRVDAFHPLLAAWIFAGFIVGLAVLCLLSMTMAVEWAKGDSEGEGHVSSLSPPTRAN